MVFQNASTGEWTKKIWADEPGDYWSKGPNITLNQCLSLNKLVRKGLTSGMVLGPPIFIIRMPVFGLLLITRERYIFPTQPEILKNSKIQLF